MIRVVIADDQNLVRAGFRALLERAEDIEVVGEAQDGRQALALVREARPDVAVLDIRMPDVDGLEAAREILADPALAPVRVIILTTFDLDEYVFEALRAGASGFLLKDVEPEALREAVRIVSRGDALLSPTVTRRVIETFATRLPRRLDPGRLATLTEREREIVGLVAEGLSNAEIADRFSLSPLTVKTHVNRAMSKVGARDRAQLVVLAYEAGAAPDQA